MGQRFRRLPERCLLIALTALLLACGAEDPAPSRAEPAAPVPDTIEQLDTKAAPPVAAQSPPGDIPAGPGWWSVLPRPEWQDFTRRTTLNPWFDVYEVQQNIFALYESGQQAENISWLIIGRIQALLFDTGTGMGDIRSVVKQLTKKPVLVLNSSSHYANVGGNHQFTEIMALNLPRVRERAGGIPRSEIGQYATGDALWKTAPANFNALDYAIKPWEFARWVQSGQLLDLGGLRLEIVHIPGYRPDSLMLLDRRNRRLFTGDSFSLGTIDLTHAASDVLLFADAAALLSDIADDVDLLMMGQRVPLAESRFLGDLDQAMQRILDGSAAFKSTNGQRQYAFTGFSIVTPDPPLADAAVIDLL